MIRLARIATTFLASASVVSLAALVAAPLAAADEERVLHQHYNGVTDDLLTAGLGATGLGALGSGVVTPPGFADPLHPTAAELRRSAIFNNYRALVDPKQAGGFGTLYGPNVKADGTVTTN